ncbi:hypothetical protein C8R43DRAFT_1116004 [Mycena crocata]|nr:hypothetical protein C8R43DRAFT_1116004 [Mycena crocata]
MRALCTPYQRLIAFLDDTISTCVPPAPENPVKTPLESFHPCATRGPGPDIEPSDLETAQAQDLHNLVERCQRHRHSDTCFKYWKYPEPRDCRFDLDESNVQPISVFDPETGEFHLRCLDGLVNNFNETMIKAIRCNMDIKFIGSGPTAKAILYYITDYITKSQLQAHVAYAALEVAVNKLGEFNAEEDDLTSRARKLRQKCAHSMISKQELSAQQVVSYLMDFEDHFTSHSFTNLYWGSFEGFINKEDPSPECYPAKVEPQVPEVSPLEQEDPTEELADRGDEGGGDSSYQELHEEIENATAEMDTITLQTNGAGNILPSANQVCDYQLRGEALQDVNVWDFVAQTEKERISKSRKKTDRCESPLPDFADYDDEPLDPSEEPVWNRDNILEYVGIPMARVEFQADHLEDETHRLKVYPYAKRKVPLDQLFPVETDLPPLRSMPD